MNRIEAQRRPRPAAVLDPAARKRLDRLRRRDPEAARRISALIRHLDTDPRPRGAAPLASGGGLYRIATGKLRVVYTPTCPAVVMHLGYRRDVYNGFGAGCREA
ncbi:plasmid stabilization protein [Streptomyces sp. CS014]|uniref:type II toxin-antitoxin system RelE family toxin n=1 Tax=Streptomyces sp. CS014 TaxID=2162707 RepID=UPI000D510A79|nr:plasmid stabilization protein [Streptomyces sp. CS014]PVD04443.1 plasmid stabilization protein [Streptomyces sp. CS014]